MLPSKLCLQNFYVKNTACQHWQDDNVTVTKYLCVCTALVEVLLVKKLGLMENMQHYYTL